MRVIQDKTLVIQGLRRVIQDKTLVIRNLRQIKFNLR